MPAIVMVAFANDLNPAIDTRRRLMARWSCSMRLLTYLFVRTLTFRQHGCSRRSSHSATTRHVAVERQLARHARKRRRERFAK